MTQALRKRDSDFARKGQAAAAQKRAALRDARVLELAERILIRNPTVTQRDMIGTIERDSGLSRSTVYRSFKRIEKEVFIRRRMRPIE